MVQESGYFEVSLENENKPNKLVTLMSGKLRMLDEESNIKFATKSQKNMAKFKIQNKELFYQYYKNNGYQLTECFAPLNKLSFDETGVYGNLAK